MRRQSRPFRQRGVAMAAPAWVAAVPSDDDEEDFPRQRIPFSATAGLGESEVYVDEDDDVQVVNVRKFEQPRADAVIEKTFYMRPSPSSTGILNFPHGRQSFNVGREVHFAPNEILVHDDMPQKKRRRKEARLERRLRGARYLPESVTNDSWWAHDTVVQSQPRGYGVLQGGPASQLRGKGIPGLMPDQPSTEEGILGRGPERWPRVEGIVGGVAEWLMDERIPAIALERRAREGGILGIRPAFLLREQDSYWSRPVLRFPGYQRILNGEAHTNGPVVQQELYNTVEETDVNGLRFRGRAPAPVRCNLERMVKGNTMREWWNSLQAFAGAELSRLHWDVLNFCKAHELKPEQVQVRKEGLEFVERIVYEIWPNAEVHLFGSTATGLALPWSDIDVAVLSPFHHGSLQKSARSMMSILAEKLKKDAQSQSVKQIPFAKVPILKVVLKSGLACDICFDVDNGLRGVPVIRRFLQQYEDLRPLCLVLKSFLGQHSLNEVYTGGLASFALVNMVVSHLQNLCLSGGGHDLGALLLAFFTRFGSMHNYETDVVSTRPNFCGSKETKGWVNSSNPELLSVEDPLDPMSDIAKSSYKIPDIRSKFLRAQKVLLTNWYEENVLGRLVDMTQIPGRALKSLEKKTKKPKQKKKNGVLAGEEADSQPIWVQKREIARKRRAQEGSDLVGKKFKKPKMASKRGRENSVLNFVSQFNPRRKIVPKKEERVKAGQAFA